MLPDENSQEDVKTVTTAGGLPVPQADPRPEGTTATTTFEGRTEVDPRELLKRPNVQKLIKQVADRHW